MMKKALTILFLSICILEGYPQAVDTLSPEKRTRFRIENMTDKSSQQIKPVDFKRALQEVTNLAVNRTPYVTLKELRIGKADTASAVYVNEAGRSGLFRYNRSDTSSPDDSVMVVKVGNKRYIRDYDGYVNVKWFGAIGDGVADDTRAIQKAIDFLNPSNLPVYKFENSSKSGGTVYFPGGRYRITETLWLTNSVTILGNSGQSFYSNRFNSTTASHIVADFSSKKFAIQTQSLETSDSGMKPVQLRRVAYDEPTHWRQSDAKKLTITSGCHIKNIIITNMGKNLLYGGIRFCSTTYSSIENVGIYDCAIGLLIDCGLHIKILDSHIDASTMGIIASQNNNSISFDHIYINGGKRNPFKNMGIPTPMYASLDSDEPMDPRLQYKGDILTTAMHINGGLSITLNNITIENWDLGIVVKNSSLSTNSLYFEFVHDTALILSRCEIFNTSIFTASVENLYGISHGVNMFDFSIKNRYASYKNLYKNYDQKKDPQPKDCKIILRSSFLKLLDSGPPSKAQASANTAKPVGKAYSQEDVQAILIELRDLKAKLKAASLLEN